MAFRGGTCWSLSAAGLVVGAVVGAMMLGVPRSVSAENNVSWFTATAAEAKTQFAMYSAHQYEADFNPNSRAYGRK